MRAPARLGRESAGRPMVAWGGAQRQSGAVLVIALVLLTVLTFLMVTALNTSSVQEKMAANVQESHRAFQTAETGLSSTFANPGLFTLTTGGTTDVIDDFGDYGASVSTNTQFRQWSMPPRNSGYSATSFQAAHFDMTATASAGGGSEMILHGGAYQIAPKAK